jgi:hypothetical protein
MTTTEQGQSAGFDLDTERHRADRIVLALIAAKVHPDNLRPFGKKGDGSPYEYEWKLACTAAAIARATSRAIVPSEKKEPEQSDSGWRE